MESKVGPFGELAKLQQESYYPMSSKDVAYLRGLKNTIWRAEEQPATTTIQRHKLSLSPGGKQLVTMIVQKPSQSPQKIKLGGAQSVPSHDQHKTASQNPPFRRKRVVKHSRTTKVVILSNVTWKVNKHIIFKINEAVSEDMVVSVDYKQEQKQAIIVLKTNEAAAKVFDFFNNQKVED